MQTYTFWALALTVFSACLSGVEGKNYVPKPCGKKARRNGIYLSNTDDTYSTSMLPVTDLSHIYYAFADIASNGTVSAGNPAVDVQEQNVTGAAPVTAAQEQEGTNAFGYVRQLFLLKSRQRNLKVLLSIGGGSDAAAFSAAASTAGGRAAFAGSALGLVTDWGLDGIDIDWEYPANATDVANYVALLAATRAAFDNYSFTYSLGYRFTISIAISASSSRYKVLDIASMNQYIDLWNLLAYDYSGNYSSRATHMSNVFAETGITSLDTNSAVTFYLGQGIKAEKLQLGLPLYGRTFENTSGLGQAFSGIGPGGPRPAGVTQTRGVWYYYQLPKAGATVLYDATAQAAYTYDAAAREFATYDNVESTIYKAEYAEARGLGGTFFFEARGDGAGSSSLVTTMRRNFGYLDRSPNNLRYPTSQYDNIRSGMPWVEKAEPERPVCN